MIDNYVGLLKGASDRNSRLGGGVWFNGDSRNYLWGVGASSIGKAGETARDRPLEHTTSSKADAARQKQVQEGTAKLHDAEDWESMFTSDEEILLPWGR
jgi:hypothetical protein